MKKHLKKIFLLFGLPVGLVLAFSIITNSQGYYRSYWQSDIPFVYKVYTGTSAGWTAAIDAGANSWNRISGAYFSFTNGGTTTSNSVSRNNVNLVFFDDQYQNFTPGSNTIAFSSTFTEGSGSGYHAVESDLIWNAGDFPPATNGDPNHIDLESTIAHEFGHHLGLGHTGAAAGSSQPGAGDVIPEATMFYAVAQGDTTPRSLHIDDKMGCIGIYKRWKLQGTVIDSVTGLPITNAFFDLNGTFHAKIGPPESVWGTQRGGWVLEDTIFVDDSNGAYDIIPFRPQFSVTFRAFGYESKDTTVAFDDPNSTNDVRNYSPRLKPVSRYNFTIEVQDSLTADPVSVYLEFYAREDVAAGFTDTLTVDTTGQASISLAPGTYDILVKPSLPYGYTEINDFVFGSDSTYTLKLKKAEILVIDDDYFSGMSLDENVENYYFSALNSHPAKPMYAYKDLTVASLPDTAEIVLFDKVVWFTGGKTANVMSTEKLDLLSYYLDKGGKLFMSGQNLLLYNYFKPLFMDYIKVGFGADNAGQTIVYNVPGDPISGPYTFFKITGEEGAFNQTTPDVMTLKPGAQPVFRYSPPAQNNYGAVRTEGDTGYKVVFMGFGFEAFTDFINASNSAVLRANILESIFNWLDAPSALESVDNSVPRTWSLKQNYPNPFNPETKIRFSVPSNEKITIEIFSMSGQKIKTLVSEKMPAGEYEVSWNGTNEAGAQVASGLYIYNMKSKTFRKSMKMVFLK